MNQNKSVLQEVLRLQGGSKAIKAVCVGSPGKRQRNKGAEQGKAASGDSFIAAKQLCTGCQSPACIQGGQTWFSPKELQTEIIAAVEADTLGRCLQNCVSLRWTHLESKI